MEAKYVIHPVFSEGEKKYCLSEIKYINDSFFGMTKIKARYEIGKFKTIAECIDVAKHLSEKPIELHD